MHAPAPHRLPFSPIMPMCTRMPAPTILSSADPAALFQLDGDPAAKKIVVAMSGGVDSSVVAALAARTGAEVIGITLQLYDHGENEKRNGDFHKIHCAIVVVCCNGTSIQMFAFPLPNPRCAGLYSSQT